MSKITLATLANLTNQTTAVTAINNNDAIISAAFENTLSRDGTAPNQMNSVLDMNNNKIINLPAGAGPGEAISYDQLTAFLLAYGLNPSATAPLVSNVMLPVTQALSLAAARTALGVTTGGSNPTVTSISGSQSIVAANANTKFISTSATSITLNLVQSNTLANGFGFWIDNPFGPVVITPNAADIITTQLNTISSSVIIPIGTCAYVFTDALGNWYIEWSSFSERDSSAPVNAVTDYGVDNTGATPCGIVLQAAVTSASANGFNQFYLPLGTYDITDLNHGTGGTRATGGIALRIPTNMTFFGSNQYLTTLKRTYDSTGVVDTAVAMVEVFGAHNVTLSGFGLLYTPTTFTLGYGQCGISVRSGSHDVKLLDIYLTGTINRGFQLINCWNIWVERCIIIGCGDACMRLVCDSTANVYPDFFDETTTVTAVHDVFIRACRFSGSTTIDGSAFHTFYGLNMGSENHTGNNVFQVFVDSCVSWFCGYQGFAVGGTASDIFFSNCTAIGINNGAGTGIGFLTQLYSTNEPQRIFYNGCTAIACVIGFYITQSVYTYLNNCHSNGGGTGCLVSSANYCTISNSTFEEATSHGMSLLTAAYCIISGCHFIANGGWGFIEDAGSGHCSILGCIAVSNTSGTYSIGGTGNVTAADI